MSNNYDLEYVAWVQRSLNRILGAGLTTNGQISELYRAWIREYQFGFQCPTRDGKVDSPTQNLIIKSNHKEPVYIQWIQESLKSLSFGSKVPVNGVLTNETKDAVRAFQSSVGLKADGYIGAKTEIAIAKKVNTMIPGYYPGQPGPPPDPPADPLKQHTDEWLKNNLDDRGLEHLMMSWLELYSKELIERPMTIPGITEREITKCMLTKLKNTANDFDYIDARTVRTYAIGGFGNAIVEDVTLDARRTLLTKIGMIKFNLSANARFAAFRKAVNKLYLDIDNGLKQLKYQIHNSGTLTGKRGTYYALNQWHERQKNRSRTIISCFPDPDGSIWGSRNY